MNSPVHRFIRNIIGFFIGYKKTTISVAFALLVLCVFGMTKVKNLFFPDFDYKQFVVECFFPSASDAGKVRDQLLSMSDELEKNPAIDRVVISHGSAPALYCLVRPMTSGGDCYGELIIDCKDYDTVLEQGGAELSQGERQLMTIARAVLTNAPILILDEATSSVDTVTEQKIRRAMLKLCSGRTSFIIAHRLSTVRDSDVIILIENGRIAEQGTHDELMRLNGKYADMYRTQTGK